MAATKKPEKFVCESSPVNTAHSPNAAKLRVKQVVKIPRTITRRPLSMSSLQRAMLPAPCSLLPANCSLLPEHASLIRRMQIIAVGVDARFVGAPVFVVLFDQELAALGTILVG
jgi:hypothetical protein